MRRCPWDRYSLAASPHDRSGEGRRKGGRVFIRIGMVDGVRQLRDSDGGVVRGVAEAEGGRASPSNGICISLSRNHSCLGPATAL